MARLPALKPTTWLADVTGIEFFEPDTLEGIIECGIKWEAADEYGILTSRIDWDLPYITWGRNASVPMLSARELIHELGRHGMVPEFDGHTEGRMVFGLHLVEAVWKLLRPVIASDPAAREETPERKVRAYLTTLEAHGY